MDLDTIDAKENLGIDEGADDDELAGPVKHPRVTPRNSIAARASPAPNPTPHASLRQLAGLIRRPSTPRWRASSVGTAYSTGKAAATPMLQPRTTPRTRRPLQPAGPSGSHPTTPHTIRALQQRRATPGRDRRKSGRSHRETPRDALRNLSKILARTSQPTRLSLLSTQPTADSLDNHEGDELEDELSPEQPHFTIAVDDEEEDESSLMAPPRLSMAFEEAEQTAKSIEMPRRALVGEDGRLSRGSFGSTRASDKFRPLGDSGTDDSYPEMEVDFEDEIGKIHRRAGSGADALDLQTLIRETPEHSDDISDGNTRPSPHNTAFSPFILKIPDVELNGSSPAHVNEQDVPFDDGVLQFGTPLPGSMAFGAPTPGLQQRAAPVQRPAPKAPPKSKPRPMARKALKISRHGISYSGLPIGISKSIASTFARSMGGKVSRLSKETVDAIAEAGDKFFEQLGSDLEAVSKHAGRKTIDESDVIAVMQRQRQVSIRATAFSLASRYLPGETLRDIRMPIPRINRRRRNRSLEDIAEDYGEDDGV